MQLHLNQPNVFISFRLSQPESYRKGDTNRKKKSKPYWISLVAIAAKVHIILLHESQQNGDSGTDAAKAGSQPFIMPDYPPPEGMKTG